MKKFFIETILIFSATFYIVSAVCGVISLMACIGEIQNGLISEYILNTQTNWLMIASCVFYSLISVVLIITAHNRVNCIVKSFNSENCIFILNGKIFKFTIEPILNLMCTGLPLILFFGIVKSKEISLFNLILFYSTILSGFLYSLYLVTNKKEKAPA